MAEAGDKVKIVTSKEEVEGFLIPSPKKDVVVVKLDNGYNVGFSKEEIKEFKERLNNIISDNN